MLSTCKDAIARQLIGSTRCLNSNPFIAGGTAVLSICFVISAPVNANLSLLPKCQTGISPAIVTIMRLRSGMIINRNSPQYAPQIAPRHVCHNDHLSASPNFAYEIYIEILSWLDLKSARSFCIANRFALKEAYRYFNFKPCFSIDPPSSLFNHIKNITESNTTFVESLYRNRRFKAIVSEKWAFLMACYNGFFEIVIEYLKKSSIDPTVDDNCAMKYATFNNQVHVIQLLLEDGRADPTIDDNYPVKWASAKGYIALLIQLLRDKRIDPSVDNNFVILAAVSRSQTEIVKILLKDGRIDPCWDNNALIKLATLRGHVDILKVLLLDTRIDPCIENNTILHCASFVGHYEIIDLLIKDGRVDASSRSNLGIKIAKEKGHLQIVELFARHLGLALDDSKSW